MTIFFFHLPPTTSHLHPLQVKNCDNNSGLLVDEEDYGKWFKDRRQSLLSTEFYRCDISVACGQFSLTVSYAVVFAPFSVTPASLDEAAISVIA